MLIFKTASPAETFAFGRKLAELARPDFVICLQGDLGAGKTLLVQGLAAGLATVDDVTSPTFTILNVYQARYPIYHFDLYRLEHQEELFQIGFDEYLAAGGVSIIEWPDRFVGCLPQDYVWLDITPGDGDDQRLIAVRTQGEAYQQVCEELKEIAGSCFRYSHPCV